MSKYSARRARQITPRVRDATWSTLGRMAVALGASGRWFSPAAQPKRAMGLRA